MIRRLLAAALAFSSMRVASPQAVAPPPQKPTFTERRKAERAKRKRK